jgi:hypothetical protein
MVRGQIFAVGYMKGLIDGVRATREMPAAGP